jgi:hypothetical protein
MDSGDANEFLRHPLTDELDDYRAYKMAISEEQTKMKTGKAVKTTAPKPSSPVPVESSVPMTISPVLDAYALQSLTRLSERVDGANLDNELVIESKSGDELTMYSSIFVQLSNTES